MTTPAGTGPGGRLLVLAAGHRARGVPTIERYDDYLRALTAAVAHCDGVLATAQPLVDLAGSGCLGGRRTYLSLNRTGLAGSAFELDDRLVASVARAAADGWTGVKLMTRIDYADPGGAAHLALLGQVLEEAAAARLEALIEPLIWRNGAMSRATDDVVLATVIAHDLGAPLLKVPVPDAPPGQARVEAVARVVAAGPAVFNHNTETVPSLYPTVRPAGRLARSLAVLAEAKRLGSALFGEDFRTKSGLMLGLGETEPELMEVLRALVAAGVDILTLGQYLRPTRHQLPVRRYLPPDEFRELGRKAKELGFRTVYAGPLVRSSFNAHEVSELEGIAIA